MQVRINGGLAGEYIYAGQDRRVIKRPGPAAIGSSTLQNVVYYYDLAGRPVEETATDGKVVLNVALDPFGNVVPYKGRHGAYIRNVVNNLRFPGQYFDAETGLHQNWSGLWSEVGEVPRDRSDRAGRWVESLPVCDE